MQAEVKILPEESDRSRQAQSLMKSAIQLFEKYIRANRHIPTEASVVAQREQEPGYLADTITSFLNSNIEVLPEKLQAVLDEIHPIKRLQIVIDLLKEGLDLMALDDKINQQVRKSVEKTHREFYLQERMKAIQKELGRGDDFAEVDELREQIKLIT